MRGNSTCRGGGELNALATFPTPFLQDDFVVSGTQAFRESDFTKPYQVSSGVVQDWVLGMPLHLRLEVKTRVGAIVGESGYWWVWSWLSEGTYRRGISEPIPVSTDDHPWILVLHLDGAEIRQSVSLALELVDSKGNVVCAIPSEQLILEGDHSLFPIDHQSFGPNLSDGLCQVIVSPESSPDEIFSPESCRALFNSDSRFFSRQTGTPSSPDLQTFSRYEIWRQLLEIGLSNESFTTFSHAKPNTAITLANVWTKELTLLFPSMSLEGIRQRRTRAYGDFCMVLQNRYLKGAGGRNE